jgi:hypothetical protein
MVGWGKEVTDEDKEAKPQVFTDADVKGWFDEKKPGASSICMAFYGFDGVCKTGVAMDCYAKNKNGTPVEPEKSIVIFDMDGSADPIRNAYHPLHPKMIVFDPIEIGPNNEIDYVTSYNKVLSAVKYLVQHEKEMNLHAVIFDGLDLLLKCCEYVMRFEDLKMDPDTQMKDSWQWARRNRRYLTPVLNLKRLKCAKFFTTHFKELKEWKAEQSGGQSRRVLSTREIIPDWEKSTPGIMYQKVLLERVEVEGVTTFEATVQKAKGKLELEGRKYTLAKVQGGRTEWTGLSALYKELGLIKE